MGQISFSSILSSYLVLCCNRMGTASSFRCLVLEIPFYRDQHKNNLAVQLDHVNIVPQISQIYTIQIHFSHGQSNPFRVIVKTQIAFLICIVSTLMKLAY